MFTDQTGYPIRFEQGPSGVAALRSDVDALVVVDVLTFTTCVDVAVSRDVTVYPYRWRDETAASFAASVGSLLAGPRDDGGVSLSPPTIRAVPEGSSVVLPSPNGAMLSLAAGEVPCFAGCLRNAASVARAARTLGARVAVIAAGERWPDGSLRSALEDVVGAGAIVHYLVGERSPEAELAEAAFLRFRDRLYDALLACSGGRELVERGYVSDVEMAAALNVSEAVPFLRDGVYRAMAL